MSGDEFEPTADEIAAQAAREPLVRVKADRWDHFLSWARDIEVPWEEDTDAYRGSCAHCNTATAHGRVRVISCSELKPTMASWVPHIACNIVPRQIVDLGDPSRRAADACESFGSCAKRIIIYQASHVCRRVRSVRGFVGGSLSKHFAGWLFGQV